MNRLKCSIGVFAYNEEANIRQLLEALLNQNLKSVEITEIVVVSSASKDRTDEIVKEMSERNPVVKLIQEKERNGKSAAINLFLDKAESDLCVIESGDTIPEPDVIEKMISAFRDEKVGMVGGRPKPVNSKRTLVGFAVHLLWDLHHEMAMISPKLGEMVAFRKVFKSIPPESAVDEASIEAQILEKGYILKYIPDAIINNKGPENFKDFIKQRRRIEAGHLWLKENQKHEVVSQDSAVLYKIMMKYLRQHPLDLIKVLLVIKIEMYSRFLGQMDYKVKKKNPFKWDIAESTKNLNRKG